MIEIKLLPKITTHIIDRAMKINTGLYIFCFSFFLCSCKEKKDNKELINKNMETIFSKGERITNNNFSGTAYLEQLIMPDSVNFTQVGNVTFEPGARTNWHYHPGGQILLVTSGTGYYQEKGGDVKVLHKGDVIKCAPNVAHWHGAGPNDGFVHVAITNTQNGPTVWLLPVTDEQYNSKKSL